MTSSSTQYPLQKQERSQESAVTVSWVPFSLFWLEFPGYILQCQLKTQPYPPVKSAHPALLLSQPC